MDVIRDCTPEELEEIRQRCLGGFLQNGDGQLDESRAFDCKECGKHYVPRTSQWIFYDLCDECFIEFDRIKMAARIESLERRGIELFP